MLKSLPPLQEMLDATYGRDSSYDGIFFVCVKSTHIFCRPSCPARKPLQRNLAFHGAVRACLLDGYRPCKRCRPLSGKEAPEWLEQLVEQVEQSPSDRISDRRLRQLGVNPHRARRYFQQHFGMTFQSYHRCRRMGMALQQLQAGRQSLAVGLDHGFDSQSGFRDAFERTFGTTPGNSRNIACITTRRLETPIGPMIAGATEEGLCLLEFADRRALARQVQTLRRRLQASVVPGDNPYLTQIETQLSEYFAAKRTVFDVPLVTPGTPFQESVWNKLLQIPCGQTHSYQWVAREIGREDSCRAVGRANGDNRIAIVIPCHRVTRADGHLCGYGGGLWRKRYLLDLEQGQTVLEPIQIRG